MPTLRRSLSFPLLLLYGLGTTIGAGVYALTGEVAGSAGMYAPLSFVIASALVACTALSFAELGSRLPRSASEAVWIRAAFDAPWLATVVVLLVALAGAVSAATMLDGFYGYLSSVVALPQPLVALVMGACVGAVAAWGIEESVLAAAVVTVVEVLALLVISALALASVEQPVARLAELVPDGRPSTWLGILSGGLLAFYAFLGFEDMVQVAEETLDVRGTLPSAIVVTLVVTTTIYFILATACVLAVDPDELAGSSAPLSFVFERTTGWSPGVITLVSMFAILNGALVQVIMAARILYGLADQGVLPEVVGRVDPRTRTPLIATVLITAVVVVLSAGFPLGGLARTTSVITLAVFASSNLSLVALKRKEPAPQGARVYPVWIPVIGFVTSAAFFVFGLVDLVG